MNVFRFGVLAFLAVTTACSPGPAPVSQSPRDPSNPTAAEGVSPVAPPPTLLASAAAGPQRSPANEPAGHDHGAAPVASSGAATADAGAAAVIYTCPMHPQITSPTPGRCPICGMNLVPRK
jgi:hypothetical protein